MMPVRGGGAGFDVLSEVINLSLSPREFGMFHMRAQSQYVLERCALWRIHLAKMRER